MVLAHFTLGQPNSPGVPADFAKHTLTCTYNDLASVRAAFEQYPQEIACIIVNAVAGNMNCVPPLPEFLPGLRALCDEFGALLIIDEVMTGFRVALAGAQDYYGVEPDLTCTGKIIGGGMPVGAFGGRRDVMDALAPTGPVYQAGTLSGNPIAMAAGFACLNEVAQPGVHETLDELTTRLAEGLLEAAEEAGIPLVVNHVGGMFGIFFTDAESVTCYQDVMACDVERFKRFFHMMLDEGVWHHQRLKRALCPWRTAWKISITPSMLHVGCLRSCDDFASPTGRGIQLTALLSQQIDKIWRADKG